MGNVGLGELMAIALVALLIFGPNRLPEIMRNLGKALRVFQEESRKAASVLKEGLETPAASHAGVIDTPDQPPAGVIDTPDQPPAAEAPPPPPPLDIPREFEDT